MDKSELFDAMDEATYEFTSGKFGDRSFPDASFIIERGAEKDDEGKTLQKFRHLPHHNKNAKSSTQNSSVDLPHLRNALARVNQVKPVKEGAASYRSRAQRHLNAHANALLKTRKEKAKSGNSEAYAELIEIEVLIAQFNCKE